MHDVITIALPSTVLEATGLTPDALKTELAIHLYEQRHLTLQQAGELLGLGWGSFVQLLTDHGVQVPQEWSVSPGTELHTLVQLNRESGAVQRLAQRQEQLLAVVATLWKAIRHDLSAVLFALELGELLPAPDAIIPDQIQIKRRAHHIQRLTALFEDMVAIEQGTFQLDTAAVPLGPLLAHVVADLQEPAQAHGIALVSHIPDDLPTVWGDTNRLYRVFLSALRNIRFGGRATSPQQIELAAEWQHPWVTITIRDTGMGEPAHYLEQMCW